MRILHIRMLKHTVNQVPSLRDCPDFIGQLANPVTCISYSACISYISYSTYSIVRYSQSTYRWSIISVAVIKLCAVLAAAASPAAPCM